MALHVALLYVGPAETGDLEAAFRRAQLIITAADGYLSQL